MHTDLKRKRVEKKERSVEEQRRERDESLTGTTHSRSVIHTVKHNN